MASESLPSAADRERFLRELTNSAVVLDGIESAAVGEAWASSAVAEWLALGGLVGSLVERLDGHRVAALVVGWIEGNDSPGGDDWLADVGTHEAVEAWELSDPGQPGERGLILTYEAASGERHDISATLIGDALAAVVVGPPGLAEAARQDTERGIETVTIDPLAGVSMLRTAVSTLSPELSAVSEASLPLLLRRLNLPLAAPQMPSGDDVELPERDVELDEYGAGVVRSALRSVLSAPAPDAVAEALSQCAQRFAAADPDALTLAEVSGYDPIKPLGVDELCCLVGGYLAPVSLASHLGVEQQALVHLEVADWIGVVLGLARAEVGSEVDGAMLVRAINKAPEITTTIPKKDAPLLAWTFESMLYAWEVTGVLIDGTVGPGAAWLLANGAVRVWDPQRL